MATHEEIAAARLNAGESVASDRFAMRELGGRRPDYVPPIHRDLDPFWKDAYTQATESVEALAEGTAAVNTPGREPGPSEMSWGRGLRPPVGLHDPTQIDQHHAIMRTNPADPTALIEYEAGDPDRGYMPRVREAGTPPSY